MIFHSFKVKNISNFKAKNLNLLLSRGVELSFNSILTHIRLASHFEDIDKQYRRRSDATEPENAASDQGLNCVLTGISIRKKIKILKYNRSR